MLEETKKDLLNDLKLSSDHASPVLDRLISGESSYLRDLRMNIKTAMQMESIAGKEAALIAYAVAVNERHTILKSGLAEICIAEGCTSADLAEAAACASLLSANNVLYRFKHFIEKEEYQNMGAKMRMNIMMKPTLGKPFFELLSLGISAVNGCQQCVNSHEASVRELGISADKIFDTVRLCAIMVSATKVI
jgi:alkyl hydroperoxide reductase subunit D